MSGPRRDKTRRAYLPMVEALEALRLFSGTASVLPTVPVEQGELATAPATAAEPPATPPSPEAWDAALVEESQRLAERVGEAVPAVEAETGIASAIDPAALSRGLAQLDRYLDRAWVRAGIAPHKHEDCTQAVYATLLEQFGRAGFDRLVSEVGDVGIREVLSRETAEGPDFFRAVDMVKKRAQRERSFQPLEAATGTLVASTRQDEMMAQWRGALEEAIGQALSPREAALIHATLEGQSPSEIAAQWGVAAKTVSNEKSRVIHKLRLFLVDELLN